jgi:hypothetical protein
MGLIELVLDAATADEDDAFAAAERFAAKFLARQDIRLLARFVVVPICFGVFKRGTGLPVAPLGAWGCIKPTMVAKVQEAGITFADRFCGPD